MALLVAAAVQVSEQLRWVPQQIGERRDILVAMDWTDFDHDSQSTLVLSLVTGHGRAASLIWLTVWKDEIVTRRNDYEDACLRRLAETMPPDCRVTILADRSFGDQKLFAFLQTLGFGCVIRFRGNIRVTDADGQSKPAAEWVGKGGRARKLRDARVTAQGRQVGAVVCVHAKAIKEPWCLAASDPEATAAVLVNHYAKRWTIEPGFRDTKDLRFDMGLSSTRIGEPARRDRLLLVSAFAMALLTLLGAVGETGLFNADILVGWMARGWLKRAVSGTGVIWRYVGPLSRRVVLMPSTLLSLFSQVARAVQRCRFAVTESALQHLMVEMWRLIARGIPEPAVV